MAVKEELMGIPSFDVPDYSELFSEEKNIIKNLKKLFLMVAGAALQKYGEKIEQQQQLMLAASDILIQVYLAESAILRAEKMAKKEGEDKVKEQIAMAKLNLFHAIDVIETAGKHSIISFSEGDEQKMMLVGLKRYIKYVNMPNIIELRHIIAEEVIKKNKYSF
jgi:hypothetical protein